MSLVSDFIDYGECGVALRVFRKGVNVVTVLDDGTVYVHSGDVILDAGDLRIKAGNVRVAQDITLKGSLTVEGEIKSNGTMTSRSGFAGPSPTVSVLAPVPPPFVTPTP